jgi:hypothetical protein
MNNKSCLLLILVFLQVFLGGCKGYRNLENLKPKYSEEAKGGDFSQISITKLVEGERILVRIKSGKEYHMYYKQMNGQNLQGAVWKINEVNVQPTEELEIPISEIAKVWAYRHNLPITVMVSLFGTFLLVLMIYAYF